LGRGDFQDSLAKNPKPLDFRSIGFGFNLNSAVKEDEDGADTRKRKGF
jgi:hypothetical protein